MKLKLILLSLALANVALSECAIIAHRGASDQFPENTVISVSKAWELGADAVEIDLRLTSDDIIVVYHDEDTEKIGGRRKLVADQLLSELQELDVGAHRGSRFVGTRIPRLSEVLKTVPKNGSILLELKTDSKILPILKKDLDNAKLAEHQIKIIGFDYKTIKQAKEVFPNIEVFWLVGISEYRNYKEWPSAIDQVIEAATRANLQGLCVKGNAVVSTRFVSLARERGMKFFVYTVNSKVDALRFKKMGVDGIITDRPDYIKNNI